jgi:hypothetical protein
MNYARLSQPEMDAVEAQAKQRWITEVLGERPTKKSVAKTLHNIYAISLLEWLGFALLICIGVVTGFKMVAIADPFARSFFPPDTHPFILNAFSLSMCLTFIFLSTSGLIYAALMDRYSAEIETQKKRTPKLIFSGGWQGATLAALGVLALAFYSLNIKPEYAFGTALVVFAVTLYLGGLPINLVQYLSPRLYHFLIYFITVWLFVVSSNGDGNVFERYGIVFAEIALAFLVENLLEKRSKWSQAVHDAWVTATKPYDERLDNYRYDEKFLVILFRQMREAMMMLERNHPDNKYKKYRPNYQLFNTADTKTVDDIIMTEYVRHTGGNRFAKAVLKLDTVEEQRAEPPVEFVQPEKRIPPQGDTMWTPESLKKDFIVRGINPNVDYSEADLRNDYEKGYEVRAAFRNGAKTYFKKWAA